MDSKSHAFGTDTAMRVGQWVQARVLWGTIRSLQGLPSRFLLPGRSCSQSLPSIGKQPPRGIRMHVRSGDVRISQQ